MTEPRSAALVRWYRRERRDFPWRDEKDPYRILVSEVMLQQTQADRVVPYYVEFLRRFPTAAALAEASMADVLDAWSGMGYNSRAERLRRACRVVSVEGWPRTADELEQLPGVGPYTAAAVASLAFDQRAAAIDTNVRRVLSRWEGSPLSGSRLSEAAAAELGANPAEWNQALMELGAQLCKARGPRCDGCPVARWCSGPDAYEPPRRQPSFEGSRRQARGAIIRALTKVTEADVARLTADTGLGVDRVHEALGALQADGLVEEPDRGRYAVVD